MTAPVTVSGVAKDPVTAGDMVAAAVKFDSGKTRWDLMPWDALAVVADLYAFGAKKYSDRNWEKGFRWGRTYAALLRHGSAWFMSKILGTDGKDPETGMSHMTAVVWNALALLTFEIRAIGEDDRPAPFGPVAVSE